MNHQRRKKKRNMCSDLIEIKWTENDGRVRTEMAALEDISAGGGCLHTEHAVPVGAHVSFDYPEGRYEGNVRYCRPLEIGHLIGIEFDNAHPWSQLDFEPRHLVGLPLLRRR